MFVNHAKEKKFSNTIKIRLVNLKYGFDVFEFSFTHLSDDKNVLAIAGFK